MSAVAPKAVSLRQIAAQAAARRIMDPVSEWPTAAMSALGRQQEDPHATEVLPVVERYGLSILSTGQLIERAMARFLAAHGRPPDYVLLSILRYLSCPHDTLVVGGTAVRLLPTPGIDDDLVEGAFAGETEALG